MRELTVGCDAADTDDRATIEKIMNELRDMGERQIGEND
jgi:hypothetical protein